MPLAPSRHYLFAEDMMADMVGDYYDDAAQLRWLAAYRWTLGLQNSLTPLALHHGCHITEH